MLKCSGVLILPVRPYKKSLLSSINPSPPKVWHKVLKKANIHRSSYHGMVQQKSMNVLDSWCGSILSHGWEILKQNWLHSVYNVHGHLTATPNDLLTFSCFQSHSKPHCVHLCLHLYLCAHCTCVCVNKWFLYTCVCVVYTYYALLPPEASGCSRGNFHNLDPEQFASHRLRNWQWRLLTKTMRTTNSNH